MSLLQDFYETTLEALRESKNDRLWFKTNTKLGKLYFDRGEYSKLQKVLKQLHQSCLVSSLHCSVAKESYAVIFRPSSPEHLLQLLRVSQLDTIKLWFSMQIKLAHITLRSILMSLDQSVI